MRLVVRIPFYYLQCLTVKFLNTPEISIFLCCRVTAANRKVSVLDNKVSTVSPTSRYTEQSSLFPVIACLYDNERVAESQLEHNSKLHLTFSNQATSSATYLPLFASTEFGGTTRKRSNYRLTNPSPRQFVRKSKDIALSFP